MKSLQAGGSGARIVSGLEVVSVLSSILLTTWGIVPLLPRHRWVMAIPLILISLLVINSHLLYGESLAEIGLTLANFGLALRLLALPTMITLTGLLLLASQTGTINRFEKLLAGLLLFPLSGIVQQYLFQGFIYRRIRIALTPETALNGEVPDRRRLAVFLTAASFALIHAPNVTLTILTFIGGLIWSAIYERAPNIYALGISHGLMSLLVVSTIPDGWLHSLSVGYKHFLYQKF